LKWRKFKEAFDHITFAVNLAEKLEDKLTFLAAYSYSARLHIISGNIQEAEKALKSAARFNSKDIPPWYKTDYLTSNFNFNIYQLEKSIQNNSEYSKISKKAIVSGKSALKNSKYFVGDRIEIYRLLGTYYWLINKQKKALKWWTKSIEFGENSGGKLELSRTFFEVGKRLSEGKSKSTELNGMSAKEYLEKAKVMFEEMDLQWDLEELEKIN
jgi:tetratricopeptide (TPR) repeat protein